MAASELFERARLAEDDSFGRQDADLIAQGRAKARGRADVDATLERERRELADALGLHDLDIVVSLHRAGLRAETVTVLEWLPAIEVAWVDGVDPRERQALSRQFAASAGPDGTGVSLVNEWLHGRPPHEVIGVAKRALRHTLDRLDAGARLDMLRRITKRCEAVGRASGGLLGLGALSWNERERIDGIREDLGDEPDPLTVDIPH